MLREPWNPASNPKVRDEERKSSRGLQEAFTPLQTTRRRDLPIYMDIRSLCTVQGRAWKLVLMRTGLNAALDPTRRSGDATEFEGQLRRRIVGQDPALEK